LWNELLLFANINYLFGIMQTFLTSCIWSLDVSFLNTAPLSISWKPVAVVTWYVMFDVTLDMKLAVCVWEKECLLWCMWGEGACGCAVLNIFWQFFTLRLLLIILFFVQYRVISMGRCDGVSCWISKKVISQLLHVCCNSDSLECHGAASRFVFHWNYLF